MPAPAPLNGSLLESHELRLRTVEATSLELVATSSANGAKLDGLANTLSGIDSKLDHHMTALEDHKRDDAGVAQRVAILETSTGADKAKKDTAWANKNLAFWTAAIGLGADLLIHFIEHAHIILGK